MGKKSHVSRSSKRFRAIAINKNTPENSAEMQKLRMRKWLENHIQDNSVPGLDWVDERNKIFRIPWKHGSLHGWSVKDVDIFKKWAIHTDKYDSKCEDTKRWKANFRCALNSLPDVQQVGDSGYEKKGKNAFRLYRFLPEKAHKQKRCNTKAKRQSIEEVPETECCCHQVCSNQKALHDHVDYSRSTIEEVTSPSSSVGTAPSSSRRESFQSQMSGCELTDNSPPMYVKEEEVETQEMKNPEISDVFEVINNDLRSLSNSPVSESQSPFSNYNSTYNTDFAGAITCVPKLNFFKEPGDYEKVEKLVQELTAMSSCSSTTTAFTSTAMSPTTCSAFEDSYYQMNSAQVPVTVSVHDTMGNSSNYHTL